MDDIEQRAEEFARTILRETFIQALTVATDETIPLEEPYADIVSRSMILNLKMAGLRILPAT